MVRLLVMIIRRGELAATKSPPSKPAGIKLVLSAHCASASWLTSVAVQRFWKTVWYESLRYLARVAAVLAFRIRHFGAFHIPPAGGVLVVANHQSYLDPVLVGMGSPRPMNYLARATLFRSRPFAWLIRSLNAIPIEREGLGLGGVKEAVRRLKRGEMVLVFPEGTRTTDGTISPFKPGFTALASRSGAAILPVAIKGAFQAWPRHCRLPRSERIIVAYGPPLLPEYIAGREDRALVAEVEARVRHCHAQLHRLWQAARR
jgi:1-acyl-sn-glycerol-3-phosphate acyltransferase